MKKTIKIFIAALMIVSSIIVVSAESDEEFEKDKSKYTILCSKPTSELSKEEQGTCVAFLQYVSNQSADLQKQLNDLEKQRDEIGKNIQAYGEKIKDYDARISTLGTEIARINEEISVAEAEIAATEEQINLKEAVIKELREKVKSRMISAQSQLRLNKYLDIIMGAKDLNDLIRRTNGLNAIARHDENSRKELQELIEALAIDKGKLEESKASLMVSKNDIVQKQNEIVVLRKTVEIAQQEARKQEAELEAQGNRIAGDYQALKELAKSLSENLNKIPNSSGFTRPVSGARVSAGTWAYPASFGGGVHLGIDYAASSGTTVRAVGNGYILKSVNGCPYGYIGSTCGSSQGGSSGGGNQIYLLTNINGTLYAVKYLHLLQGSPIAQGTIVSAGDTVGLMGSSGNSTGVHTHVEVMKLGTMSITSYVESWNGDLSFGAGWGSAALNRTCSNTGAPCRVRPEEVFE